MNKLLVFLLVTGLIAAFACQKELDLENGYSTTVEGNIQDTNGRPRSLLKLTIGSTDATTDSSGNYSATTYHSGSFIFIINTRVIQYSETISTKESKIIKNLTL